MEEGTLRTRKAIQPDMPRRLHHGSGMFLEIMTLADVGWTGTKGSTWDSEMPYHRRTGANTLLGKGLRNEHLDFAGRQLHLQELPDVLQLL
jgi:hypothetical protein